MHPHTIHDITPSTAVGLGFDEIHIQEKSQVFPSNARAPVKMVGKPGLKQDSGFKSA